MTLARLPEGVTLRSFGNETIVLNLQTGQYHALNATATRMVEVIGEADDWDEAIARLTEEFAAPQGVIGADLRTLCERLEQRGLLEMLDAS